MSEELEKDKCVICGTITQYNKTDNVSIRKDYVEGAGQLCGACFKIVYDRSRE